MGPRLEARTVPKDETRTKGDSATVGRAGVSGGRASTAAAIAEQTTTTTITSGSWASGRGSAITGDDYMR